DPIHPWVRGAATLYTKEYFELCKKHLNPGGLVTQWVPLYQSDLATVKSEIATFFQVFPHGTIWSNDDYGEGYDIVLLGQAEPARIDVDDLQQRLQDPAYSSVAHSLKEVGFSSAVDLLAKFTAQGQDLGPWLANAAINRDENLRLQYLAGMGLKKEEPQRIHDEMTAFRKFPEGLFVASAQSRKALQQAWEGAKELRDMEGP
ncbi:MAG: SAM-dependent methyltransferase, partial [Planctomycetes bacterium]|nr:SAM-dependent methyltransferase [Planctomycetota bacterium]